MRISHFFIDRPIFAAVVSIVFVILGAVSFARLPVAQYPEIAPPIINVSGQYPGASADVVASTVVTPARAADQRRREHALHVVEFDGRRALHDRRHLRSRHQSRYRPGAGAEPRRDRAAAASCRRAQYRRDRDQELARPDDGRASLLARQVARQPVHFQLCHTRDYRYLDPRRRGRLDHRVRQSRLLDAHLGRSRSAADASADRERRRPGAASPERPGRRRRARSAADAAARRVSVRGADARAPCQSGRIRQYRGEAGVRRRGPSQGRGAHRARRPGLYVQLLPRSRPGGGAGDLPAARFERAGDGEENHRHDG